MVDTTSAGYVPVNKDGDTMTGDLTLVGAPTTDLMASTKKYVDDNVSAGGANAALSNLAAVAINTTLVSDTDLADDLGTASIRWDNVYCQSVVSGDTAADQLVFSAYDVDGTAYVDFITMTANNTPTCIFSGDITGVTQAPADNSTKLATTAYADAAATAVAGANTELSNLGVVAINTTLKSDTDLTDDLGTPLLRWASAYCENLATGQLAGNEMVLSAYDVDGASYTDFITMTANNTPTCVLSGSVTGVTQTVNDGSTKLATTAYADDIIVDYANLVGSDVLGPAYNFAIGCNDSSPSAVVTSDGATITLTYQANGGGDVMLFFSGGPVTMDCTPAVTATLTAGTDAVPVTNYAYILKSAPTIITVNQTGFPTTVEFVSVGKFTCPTAATAQTYGLYNGHVWTNEMWKDTMRNGHLYEIGKWIRSQPATWISGSALTPTLTPGSPDTLTFAISTGESFQFHQHTLPAFDSSTGGSTNLTTFFVVNDNAGAYNQGKDLYNFKFDNAGNAASNNSRISWVVWAVVSEDSGDCKIMVNLPSDFYSNDADAISDPSRYSNYNIPEDYKGTGFLLAKLTYQYTAAAGGTLTLVEQVDLRGTSPNVFAGGSAGSGANVALDNLSGVAINTSLISDTTNTDDLGSSGILWKDIFATRGLLTTIELGAGATDTTLARSSAGNMTIEGNLVYRAGGTDVPLADGGTNASLTANNGGIFYSTATAGAILAGTGVAGRIIRSGVSSAPSWSTATYPATTTANQILYSNATNTVTGLASAASSVLVTSAGSVPSLSTALPSGVTAATQAITVQDTTIATTANVNQRVKLGQTNVACSSNITYTQNIDTNHYFKLTFTSNCTLAFTFTSGLVQSMCVDLINEGAFTVTWPAGLQWPGGSQPDFTAAGTDCVVIWNNGDNVIRGALIGQAYS